MIETRPTRAYHWMYQYCWAGDHTLEAIEAGVEAVVETDAGEARGDAAILFGTFLTSLALIR